MALLLLYKNCIFFDSLEAEREREAVKQPPSCCLEKGYDITIIPLLHQEGKLN